MFVFFMMILQVVKKVFVETNVRDDFPEELIREEVGEMEVFNAPRPEYWLRDSTVLKEVDHVVFSPEEIFDKRFYSKLGIPESIGGDPRLDLSRDLCPSSLLDEKAMKIVNGTLFFINKFEIDSIIYYHPSINPLADTPMEIRCVCKRCMDKAQSTMDGDSSVTDLFKKALAGKTARSPDDVKQEIIGDMDDYTAEDVDSLVDKYKREYIKILDEKKAVYGILRDKYFRNQGNMMMEANRAILNAIKDNTEASVKIVQPFLVEFALEESENISDYGEIAGFKKELLDEFDIKCVYSRVNEQGGEIIHEFPYEKRGIKIYTGDTDDTYNLRMISHQAESGDVLVTPADTESLIEVLRSLSMWL